ncbi:hypothetical protein BKA70DRAFT_1433626 [Coprinopsis sp. MPI-PUGE-AT-0042]|nr:hypothetical protein BKA70DRAFT_1433626 [Coprinopsis sp. MPI-PUGE-AT-0042]
MSPANSLPEYVHSGQAIDPQEGVDGAWQGWGWGAATSHSGWGATTPRSGSEEVETLTWIPSMQPHAIFANIAVLWQIAAQCCWRNMVAMAGVSKAWRKAAQTEARSRVSWAVSGVLTAFGLDAPYFFFILQNCGGALVGTTAHRALMVGMPISAMEAAAREKRTGGHSHEARRASYIDSPRRLTVLVPSGKRDLFMSLVDRQRAHLWMQIAADWIGGGALCVRRVCEAADGFGNQQRFIRVVESVDTVALALSNSSTTGDMVALSNDRVYVPYPRLSLNNMALVRWVRREHMHQLAQPRPIHPEEQPFDKPWGVACRLSCPALWKKARKGDGIATFFWNSQREQELIRGADQGHEGRRKPCTAIMKALDADCLLSEDVDFKWRLSNVCPNHEE